LQHRRGQLYAFLEFAHGVDGLYKSGCGRIVINLTKTCPIDNFLTLFSLNIQENSHLMKALQTVNKPYAEKLLEVVRLYHKGHFSECKIKWLEHIKLFDVSSSGTLDVWGNEEELFTHYIQEAFTTTVTSTCSSTHCPQKTCTSKAPLIHLEKVTMLKPNESYLQGSIREWLHPSPIQCGENFKSNPPPGEITYDVIL